MIEQLRQLIDELNLEKAKSDKILLYLIGCNLDCGHHFGRKEAFSLCINKLEKILKEIEQN